MQIALEKIQKKEKSGGEPPPALCDQDLQTEAFMLLFTFHAACLSLVSCSSLCVSYTYHSDFSTIFKHPLLKEEFQAKI